MEFNLIFMGKNMPNINPMSIEVCGSNQTGFIATNIQNRFYSHKSRFDTEFLLNSPYNLPKGGKNHDKGESCKGQVQRNQSDCDCGRGFGTGGGELLEYPGHRPMGDL
jgi:hypothetical protein